MDQRETWKRKKKKQMPSRLVVLSFSLPFLYSKMAASLKKGIHHTHWKTKTKKKKTAVATGDTQQKKSLLKRFFMYPKLVGREQQEEKLVVYF